MKFVRIFIIIFMQCSIIFPASASTTTEWLNAYEFRKFYKKVLYRGHVPTSMKCKPISKTKGLSRKNTLIKTTYRKNPEKLRWYWAWGSRVAPEHIRLTKEGYKRVSYQVSTRKSGLKLACAIWHKPRK